MMQFAIIGIGAGAAAALLFASVTSGSWLSIPLFYLAPLPIMIAGLGWSHWAALIAALDRRVWRSGSCSARSSSLRSLLAPAFPPGGLAISPCWLGRRSGNGHERRRSNGIPPGRLVMWAAILGALVVHCRHSEFRHRRQKLPRAALRDAA